MNNTDQLALALASGQNVPQAAKSAEISERTAFRRLKEPEFLARVRQARLDMWERAVGQLTDASNLAVETLVALLGESNAPSIRLRAASQILVSGPKLLEQTELVARIDLLEEVLREKDVELEQRNGYKRKSQGA